MGRHNSGLIKRGCRERGRASLRVVHIHGAMRIDGNADGSWPATSRTRNTAIVTIILKMIDLISRRFLCLLMRQLETTALGQLEIAEGER